MSFLEKPIIFIGLGRSGTTIISEIIFQHEDLAWTSNYQGRFVNAAGINKIRPILDNRLWQLRGQKKQLNKVAFYNKVAFKPAEIYNFWNAITRDNIDFSRGFLLNMQATEAEQKYIRGFFEKMVKYQKRKRLAFKITGPGRISYLNSIFPDAIFIEITRAPFANIRSLLEVPFWENHGKHQLWWTGAYSEEEIGLAKKWKDKPALLAALQYKKVRDKTRDEINLVGVDHLMIAFEDFVKEPQRELNRILTATGLKKSKKVEKYLERNEIHNRNINAIEYFSQKDQEKMIELLGEYYIGPIDSNDTI